MKRLLVLLAVLAVPGVAAEDFLAVGHANSPFISIYENEGGLFTKVADPATLPAGKVEDPAFSPNGQFMAGGHANSPFVSIYEITGTTFTKLANPATLPTGTGYQVAFSPESDFMAVAHQTTPFVSIYSISGTTFTKLANPATLPTGNGIGACFSPDGEFLAITHEVSPFVSIYQISGTTFTKITNPNILPTGITYDCDFNDESDKLAVAGLSTNAVIIYDIQGTTFTKIANPAVMPTGSSFGVDFSGDLLAAVDGASPWFIVWEYSGNVFTKVGDPSEAAAANSRDVAFSGQGNQLAVSGITTPFMAIYSIDGANEFTKLPNPSTLPAGASDGVAFPSEASPPLELFCSEPFAARFGYNFNEGWRFENALQALPTQPFAFTMEDGYFSAAQSDNSDYLGVGFDRTSRAYEVHFTVEAAQEGDSSNFRTVFSFTDDIPSVGNKGNGLVSTGAARESVRATLVERSGDWEIALHEVVNGVDTETDSDTISDNPNVPNSYVFVVDTRTGTEEYRLEREDGTALLTASLDASHVDAEVGSQWFVHTSGTSETAYLALNDPDGSDSTCVVDQEGISSLDAPAPGPPGGQGGTDGGTIGDQPFFPGVNVGEVATQSGMSLDQVGWMIGILLIVAFAAMLAPFGMIMAAVGGLSGLGLSIAFGLVPVWFLVFIIILVLGAIVYLRKG